MDQKIFQGGAQGSPLWLRAWIIYKSFLCNAQKHEFSKVELMDNMTVLVSLRSLTRQSETFQSLEFLLMLFDSAILTQPHAWRRAEDFF